MAGVGSRKKGGQKNVGEENKNGAGRPLFSSPTFFCPSFGGVDWDAARRKYEPRVAKTKKDGELYLLLNEMLGELHQSHFGIIPPEAILEDGSLNLPGGNIGIDLRIVDGQVLISRVAPDSTASRAGLRAGFVIKRIDGAETAKMRKEIVAHSQSFRNPGLTQGRWRS